MAPKTITKMQDETRRKQHFSETEASFEDRRTRKAAPTSTLQALFSRLGPLNPVSSPVRSDDIVWLFDNTAYIPQPGAAGAAAVAKIMPDKAPAPLARIGRAVGPKLETSLGSWGYFPPTTQKGQENWAAEFTFAVFEKEAHCSVVDAVSDIAHKIGLADDCQDKARIEERLTPFLLDVRPARKVVVEHAGRELRLGPTGSSGVATNAHGVAEASVRDKDHGGLVSGRGVVPRGVEGILTMKTYYSGPEGWGVISDVDDTIKITQTSDPIGILRSTFVEPATPITGTPELYAHLLSTLRTASPNPTEHVPFFYLSASPYNLYPFLRQFVTDAAFPPGQLMLRDSSWKTLAGLLSALTVGTEAYKMGQMRRVRAWFPRRKMIFIGDSTQSDPEAYGHVYREYPGWVKLILIRRATDIAAVGIEAKNAPERFEEAFEGVPRSAWHVFDDPAECVAKIDEVVRAH